jgi:Family of unknown function (DUF6353)
MIGLARLAPLANQAKFLLNQNAPAVLTGVGVAGTITTAYLTGRASFKAADILEEKSKLKHVVPPKDSVSQAEIGETHVKLTKFEKTKLVWHLYIPPTITGLTAVTAIIAANRISTARLAAMAVSAGISERALNEYREKVLEKFGERDSTKVRDEIAQDRVLKNPRDTRDVIITGSGDVLCYDMLTGRYFMSSAEKIRRAENHINYELNNSMYASLTEFYDHIGLAPTTYTDTVGWSGNENLEVKISAVQSDDEKPCLAIDFLPMPTSEYRRSLYD